MPIAHLSKDQPFKPRRVRDEIIKLLKEFYPGKVHFHGLEIYARNLDHYAAGNTAEAFFEKFWTQFTCDASDKDDINLKLLEHCRRTLCNLLNNTQHELAKLHCKKKNIQYSTYNGQIEYRHYAKISKKNKDLTDWLGSARKPLFQHWSSTERRLKIKCSSQGSLYSAELMGVVAQHNVLQDVQDGDWDIVDTLYESNAHGLGEGFLQIAPTGVSSALLDLDDID